MASVCAHKYRQIDNERLCILCGDIIAYRPVMVTEYRSGPPLHHITYQATEYVTRKAETLAGFDHLIRKDWISEDSDGNQTYHDGDAELRAALHACITWREVYKYMRSICREKCYLKVPSYMGGAVYVPRWVVRVIHEVVYGGYKLQMLYVLYKIYEQQGDDPRLVPLRSSKTTLKQSDEQWKLVCWDYGIPYKSTPPVLPTPWS